jgi:hypothetical protein
MHSNKAALLKPLQYSKVENYEVNNKPLTMKVENILSKKIIIKLEGEKSIKTNIGLQIK